MSNVIYQASSLRAMVKQLLPCAESKNISDSNYCSLGILSRKRTSADGTLDEEQLLYAETHQPSFCMGLGMVLTTEDVKADNQLCVRVLTRDLDNALACFGQRMVYLQLQDNGDIMLSTVATSEDDDNTLIQSTNRMMCVHGEKVEPLALPEDQKKSDTNCLCGQVALKHDTCTLANKMELLDSLRFSVPLAATRGNGLRKQGVLLQLSPEYMHVEGSNQSMYAMTNSRAPWLQAPHDTHTCMLATDSVRHLLSALSCYGEEQSLTLTVSEYSGEQRTLAVQCDLVMFILDC
jgi:hypothetical protein